MTAHVSDSPNQQSGRSTSMGFRHNVAMAGNFGYELDVTKLNRDEKNLIKEQTADYKSIRRLVQFGDLYRLLSPFESNYTSFLYVSEDKKEAVLFIYKIRFEPNGPLFRFRLDGLEEDYNYRLKDSGLIISGAQLMNYGINEPEGFYWGDFNSKVIRLKAEE